MRNTFGNAITMSIFGESHGQAIGVVLDGLPAGFDIDLEKLDQEMDKRRARGELSTKRQEADKVEIVSGYFNGKTTGTPLCMLIQNTNTRSQDYAQLKNRLRPSHADFTAYKRYDGYQDYRGGGHFSGRLTAPLVAAGAVCKQILETAGIKIGAHILQLKDIEDTPFSSDPLVCSQQIELLSAKEFPALDVLQEEKMKETIKEAAMNLDSVGGILEGAILGVPAGIGEPMFDSVESELSHLLFSVPAVKGVSFGIGFDFAGLTGSLANDPIIVKDGTIQTATNHNGGINGGITNGMPITFRCVIKPTPSIYQKQDSVDYQSLEPVKLEIKGRHDPAIIHRARVVAEAVCAFGILDLWMMRPDNFDAWNKKWNHKEKGDQKS